MALPPWIFEISARVSRNSRVSQNLAIDYIDIFRGIHHSRAKKKRSHIAEIKRLPKRLLLTLIDRLMNATFYDFSPLLFHANVCGVLEPINGIHRKTTLFPLIFSPMFVFICPLYSFSFHCTWKKLLFDGF